MHFIVTVTELKVCIYGAVQTLYALTAVYKGPLWRPLVRVRECLIRCMVTGLIHRRAGNFKKVANH